MGSLAVHAQDATNAWGEVWVWGQEKEEDWKLASLSVGLGTKRIRFVATTNARNVEIKALCGDMAIDDVGVYINSGERLG